MAMKHFTLLFACILCTLQLMADQYYPLVEQGKTWRYEYSDGGTSGGPYIDGMLRIDEAVTINGKEYYVVRQYSRLGNTEFDEDGIVAYLREDTEAKRVWCIIDPSAHLIRYPERVTILMYPEEEFLLYDFVKPDGVAFYQDGEPHMFTAKDGSQRNSFPLYGYMKYMITEGIGFLGDAYSCDDEAVSMPGDIFGAVPLISSVSVGDAAYYLPTLYEVTEPDGTVLYCNERVKERATEEKYYPLVEQGKTWLYKCTDQVGYVECPVIDVMLRIDEAVTINGKDYYALRQYSREGNDDYEEDAVIAYLREDTEAKQVWCINHDADLIYPQRMVFWHGDDEYIFYDFTNPDNMDYIDSYEKPHLFTAYDGSLRRSIPFYGDAATARMITEGIGYLLDADQCNDERHGCSGDLFGEAPLIASIPIPDAAYYIPHLYEVTEPDGTVIFNNNSVRAWASVETAKATKGCEITVEGHNVTVSTGTGSLGEITVTGADGVTVRRFRVDASQFTFNIDGYMPGVYVVRCGDAIRKIAVR